MHLHNIHNRIHLPSYHYNFYVEYGQNQQQWRNVWMTENNNI